VVSRHAALDGRRLWLSRSQLLLGDVRHPHGYVHPCARSGISPKCCADTATHSVLIAVRVFCRLAYGHNGLIRGLGFDDIITIVCWLVFLVTCILITIGVEHGLGRHMLTLSDEQIVESLRYNVIISSVLIWVFSLPKFAIVALLKRILAYDTRTGVLFWGLALTSQACILATSVWWFKQCSPVEYGWDRSIAGSCADVSVLANLGYFTSAYSAFLDIFFALYPIPLIMRLNLRLRSRITISIAMGLSALACVVSIYKLAIFGDVFQLLPTDPTCKELYLWQCCVTHHSQRFIDPVAYLDILGMAEGFILLVCASLPTLGPLVRTIRGKTIGSKGTGSGSHPQQKDTRDTPVRRNSWQKNRLTDDADSTHQENEQLSVDEIPLVTTQKTQRDNAAGIHKDTEIAVWSEARTADSKPTTRADQSIYMGP
jgi:hypothetical protein